MGLLDTLEYYITPTTVTIYLAIHVLTYIMCITIGSKHLINADPELNKKYAPFARTDIHLWSIVTCFPWYITFWPRFLTVAVIIIFYTAWAWFCMIGHEPGTPLHPIRRILTKKLGQYLPRLMILLSNVYYINVERPEISYKQWLGPDWVPSYDNASTYVVNHQIWLDILVFMWWNLPSFVSKKEVRNMPGVGKIAECIQSLFLERGGSKEQNRRVIQQISERQKMSEQGKVPPLLVFPEGCTSNGNYLLPFKKGCFVGENSIQPFAFIYGAPYINPSHDVMGNFAQFFLITMTPYVTLTIKEYPVFKPNEYFWKNHYDKSTGRSRWELYAETIRGIIASSNNLILSDQSVEEKLTYRALLEGKTPRTRKAD